MADPKGPETGTGAKGASSARPRPQTLDLSATDVSGDAAKASEAAKPEAKPGAAASSAKTEPPKSAAPGAAPSGPEPAKPAGPGAGRTDVPPMPPRPVVHEGFGWLGGLGFALLGAALAVLCVSLLQDYLIRRPQPDMSRVAALESRLKAVGEDVVAVRQLAEANDPKTLAGRLDAIDGKVGAMDGRVGGVVQTVEAAGGRVAALETEIRLLRERVENPKQDPAIGVLTGRVEGLEFRLQNIPSLDALEVMTTRVENAERRAASAADREDVSKLANRIGGVSERVDPLGGRIDSLANQVRAIPRGDPAARLVVAISALDQALAAGRPFAAELATAKTAAGDGAELAALEPFATTGVATRRALAGELAAIMAKLEPLKAPPKGTILERFVANAGGVLTITQEGGGDGTDASAARAKLASLAAADDIEQALAWRGKLDEAGRAATEAWAAQATARIAAENAVRSARAAALARLAAND